MFDPNGVAVPQADELIPGLIAPVHNTNNLVPIVIQAISPPIVDENGDPAEPDGYGLNFDENDVRIWKDQARTEPFHPGNSLSTDNSTELWVEGVTPGLTVIDLGITAPFEMGGANDAIAIHFADFNLQMKSVSRTVARGRIDDNAEIPWLTKRNKTEVGAEIRVNANFDKDSTKHVEDFRIADQLNPADNDLLDATINLHPPLEGKWLLTFTNHPENIIRVWAGNVNTETGQTNWTVVTSGVESSPGVYTTVPLKIEGVDGSSVEKDVTLRAEFHPSHYGTVTNDLARLTVVKSEFMLTFDDGPFAGQTTQILNALQNVFTNSQPIRAAFFQIGKRGVPLYQVGAFGIVLSDALQILWSKSRGRVSEGIGNQINPNNNQWLTRLLFEHYHHVVGNHTDDHDLIRHKNSQSWQETIDLCRQKINEAIGSEDGRSLVFRAPGRREDVVVPYPYQPAQDHVISGYLPGDFVPGGGSQVAVSAALVERLTTWNTRREPKRKAVNNQQAPLCIILHDWAPSTYSELTTTIDDLRSKGFPLVDFTPSQCSPENVFYDN